jgi:general secretion pathway protein E
MAGIVSKDKISTLPVEYSALQYLSKQEATAIQCIIFSYDKQKETIAVLTTNNFPKEYHQLIDTYKEKWYDVNTYFTDDAWFSEALKWYDTREEEVQKKFLIHQKRIRAEGQDAISLLQETYKKRAAYSEGAFLQEILRLAYQAGASDVHFQTEEQGVQMRIRKDGILQPVFMFAHEEFSKYLMKIKFMAGAKMNIIHHSQDGRFQTTVNKDDTEIHIDVRASFLPSLRGESIVLRFLDETSGIVSLTSLGMQPRHINIMDNQLKKHHGLILVAWPTGSWKTTTVYTLLHQLNHPDKKIITLEDPVEYEIDGITQSQINEAAGYTFEEWLKGILRHDPDIIVVGEMRTLASAQLAINAAITWHLVISTIHTNSAVEAVSRLLNMGIPAFMLTASLNCIIGQRLVRKAVDVEPMPTPEALLPFVQGLETRFKKVLPTETFPYEGKIYSLENQSEKENVYAGRMGIFECVTMNQELKQAILEGQTTIWLQALVDKQWFLTMEDDAWVKMFKQQTTLEEIERVV